MILDLQKGMTLDLTKSNSAIYKKIRVGVNWGAIGAQVKKKEESASEPKGLFGSIISKIGSALTAVDTDPIAPAIRAVDLDLSVIMYNAQKRKTDVVYYGQRSAAGIRHSGDDRVGDNKREATDNEVITIDFDKISDEVKYMAVVLNSFNGIQFNAIPYAEANIYNDQNDEKIANTNLVLDNQYSGKYAMVFGIFELTSEGWEYKSVCAATKDRQIPELIVTVATML